MPKLSAFADFLRKVWFWQSLDSFAANITFFIAKGICDNLGSIMENIEIESVGKLIPHPDVPDEWLISEPISIPLFDGKLLKVTFNVDLENDKQILAESDKAIKNFLQIKSSERMKFSQSVYKNYRQIQDYYDSQDWGASALELNNENEIWQFVYPHEVYICRGYDADKSIYLIVTCGCEWEPEHGLQLVFKNGVELSRISDIDYNPTE